MSGPSPFQPPTPGTNYPGGQPPQEVPPNNQPAQAEFGYQPPPQYPPAQQPAGYSQTPQQAPKKNKNLVWIILGVVLAFMVLLIGGCAVAIVLFARSDGGQEFVSELAIDFSNGVPAGEPATCEVDGLDFVDDYRVLQTVTNISDTESHYLVDFELSGQGGTILGTDFGIVSNLPAGDTVTDDANGVIGDAVPWQDVDCVVLATTRVAADN